jgi:hypothetical protein
MATSAHVRATDGTKGSLQWNQFATTLTPRMTGL